MTALAAVADVQPSFGSVVLGFCAFWLIVGAVAFATHLLAERRRGRRQVQARLRAIERQRAQYGRRRP